MFNEVASVAILANGFVGFGGGIPTTGTLELVPCPGAGCEVTGASPSLKSSCFMKKKIRVLF